MSTPNQPDSLSPKDLQYYAPRKLRDGVNDPSIEPAPRTDDPPNPQTVDDWTTYPVAPLPKSFRTSLDGLDKLDHERPAGFIRIKTLGIVAGAAVAGIAIGVGLLELAQWRNGPVSAKDAEPLATRLQAAATDLQKVTKTGVAPTLTVSDGSGEMNAALPLGVEVKNSIAGATIILSGLPPGTAVSAGTADNNGQWRIAVDDLPKTRVTPPQDYVGLVNAIAELRTGNGTPIVRSPVRLAWRQPPAERRDQVVLRPAPPPPAPVNQASPVNQATAVTQATPVNQPTVATTETAPALAARQLDAKEVAALSRRAEELLANGDLVAARLLLQRVAETRNARAAYQLATTYDPVAMKKYGNISVAADAALALLWYQRARDWGSTDASGRLEALASQNSQH
jgi:hypothetical protein